MTDEEQARLTKAAADYMRAQFGDDAVLEARIGRRHAEVVGNPAAVEAFQSILDYLLAHPVGEGHDTAGGHADQRGNDKAAANDA